jgi:mannose-6-phosphate isomerase-like protein (cupin superfamily)
LTRAAACESGKEEPLLPTRSNSLRASARSSRARFRAAPATIAHYAGAAFWAVGAVGAAAHAQPGPQGDSEVRITAWAPKPVELPPYTGVNRPHSRLAELVARHSGSQSWSETLVDDRQQVAKYVAMAPGERTPRRLHPDTPIFWVVQRGSLRFTIEGEDPFVATKGFLVQVPYRTPYELETVGDEPSLRLEVTVAGASTLYPRGEQPVPIAGQEFVEVTLPGRGRYDEDTRPYLDFFGDVVRGNRRPGFFVREDRLMAVLIRGQGTPRPPDTDRGHMHIDYGELWLVLEGKTDYLIEGVPFFTAGEGDVVYVPAGRFHRPTFGGDGMSTRLGINGFHSGVHVELVQPH